MRLMVALCWFIAVTGSAAHGQEQGNFDLVLQFNFIDALRQGHQTEPKKIGVQIELLDQAGKIVDQGTLNVPAQSGVFISRRTFSGWGRFTHICWRFESPSLEASVSFIDRCELVEAGNMSGSVYDDRRGIGTWADYRAKLRNSIDDAIEKMPSDDQALHALESRFRDLVSILPIDYLGKYEMNTFESLVGESQGDVGTRLANFDYFKATPRPQTGDFRSKFFGAMEAAARSGNSSPVRIYRNVIFSLDYDLYSRGRSGFGDALLNTLAWTIDTEFRESRAGVGTRALLVKDFVDFCQNLAGHPDEHRLCYDVLAAKINTILPASLLRASPVTSDFPRVYEAAMSANLSARCGESGNQSAYRVVEHLTSHGCVGHDRCHKSFPELQCYLN